MGLIHHHPHQGSIAPSPLVGIVALEWASLSSWSTFPVIARSQTFTAVPPPEAYRAAPGKAQPHSTGLPWFTWGVGRGRGRGKWRVTIYADYGGVYGGFTKVLGDFWGFMRI